MGRFHLAQPRDGVPVSCDCKINHDHDGEDVLVVEHAVEFTGGHMLVRQSDPEVEEIYPLAAWIAHKRRHGQRVYTRTVLIHNGYENNGWREVRDG